MSGALETILQHPEFPQGTAWREEVYEADDTVLPAGDTSRDLFLIVSGVVRINLEVDIDARHHVQPGLGELTAGDTFGELNLFGATARGESVVALSTTRLIRIHGEHLAGFMDTNPALGYGVLRAFFLEHATLLRAIDRRLSGLYAERLKSC